mmetsp:Transcript_14599/g.22654  ORF Transcript_14599/g.22654 Transcript_14599/m.22654 type:complete len:136 (-) Transcript_14599:291-698(-)|eukprot:CAMPEP_0184291438 /NCGR_PEP_ID=MMETSP1049-20130417/3479_1 /TAXON_ID=77928 /ORGANISM="Proteomonas sulcata, Strain CCMP704" /LENGTH=135 /DNA_ID=CAMNT_0026598903 /DNA_START=609 /DNA_END=1016 /DNA_ORIENTATION=+
MSGHQNSREIQLLQAQVQNLQQRCQELGLFVPELPPSPDSDCGEEEGASQLDDKGSRERLRMRGNSSSGKKRVKRQVQDTLLRMVLHLQAVMENSQASSKDPSKGSKSRRKKRGSKGSRRKDGESDSVESEGDKS